MLAPPQVHIGERAACRLLADCASIAGLAGPPRARARERLDGALGVPLASRLVSALAGDHRMRTRERVA